MEHLVDHLACGKRAHEARHTRGAEGATHGATGLRGNADGKFVTTRHANGFNSGSVGKREQIFAGAIARHLASGLGRSTERVALIELLAKCLGQVGHLIERADVFLEEPLTDLFGAKRRLAQIGDELGEIFGFEGADVTTHGSTLHMMPFEDLGR